MLSYVSILRPSNSIMAGIGAFIGYSIAYGGITFNSIVVYAILAAFFVSSAGMVINDYFDREVDAKLKPKKPIPSGKIKPNVALFYSLALFFIGNALAYLINPTAFAIAIAFSLLLVFYSAVLSKFKYIGNWVIASATAFTFIFGSVAFHFSNIVLIFAISALLTNVARELGKDFEDLEADKGFKKSLPMIVPEKAVQFIIILLTFIAIFLVYVPYFLLNFGNLWFLTLVTAANVVFIYSVALTLKRNYNTLASITKTAMGIALIGFLVGIF